MPLFGLNVTQVSICLDQENIINDNRPLGRSFCFPPTEQTGQDLPLGWGLRSIVETNSHFTLLVSLLKTTISESTLRYVASI